MENIEIYKDSRIAWMGEIPKTWKVVSLRRLVLEHRQGFYTSDEYVDQGTKLLRITDINDLAEVSYENCPQVKITDKDFDYFKVSEGDFLFARSGTIGRFGVVQNVSKAIFASYLIKFSFNKNLVVPNFIKNYFFSPLFNSGLLSDLHGGANQNINAENIKNQFLVLPELEEQKRIACYLDNKTQNIIKIIRQKELLLEKLQAKRQAIINEAVTKGLNPNVPMKPSGVEWLGDIPEHWKVKRLKYLTKITTGNKNTEDRIEDGLYPFFVRSQTVERINSYSFDGEGILTAGDGVGVAKVFHYINGKFDFHQRVYLFYDFSDDINARFLFYYLKSNLEKEVLRYNAKSTVDSLRLPMFKAFPVSLPDSKREQEMIVDHMDRKCDQIDNLSKKLLLQIQKIKQYRQSLISEVVTGKIKVV